LAKTDNFEDDEVNDTSKTPLERPLEAIKSNKRSEIDTTESNDKVGKLEGNSSLGKMEQETAELNMAASVVEESAKLRYKFLSLEDNVDTAPFVTETLWNFETNINMIGDTHTDRQTKLYCTGIQLPSKWESQTNG